MSLKLILLISTILLFASSYETEGDVLVLGDSDFPQVLEDHPFILVEFYAPWCGHCKHLAPVYQEAATALKEQGSEIKLAKVDATIHKQKAGEYGVRGFPTLFFFINGSKIDYKGDRTKDGIISWVSKKILPVTSELSSTADFQKLSSEEFVSVVLFSNDKSQIAEFERIAVSDDYNRYYVATGDLLGSQSSGTVKLIRNFDEEASFSGEFDTLKAWVAKNARPALLPFDDRTIQSIFGEAKKAVVFINPGTDDATIRDAVVSEAKGHDGDLIFTEITKSSEHFDRLSDYIKVKVEKPRIVIIDGGKQKKFVQTSAVTADSLKEYLKSFIAGEAKEYGLTDAVAEEQEQATTDEEL